MNYPSITLGELPGTETATDPHDAFFPGCVPGMYDTPLFSEGIRWWLRANPILISPNLSAVTILNDMLARHILFGQS